MIIEIQNIIAKYVNKNADLEDWASIRSYYFKYTYLSFVTLISCIAMNNPNQREIVDYFNDNSLEDSQILKYMISTKDSSELISDIKNIILPDSVDINAIYQSFLSRDYKIANGIFSFTNGKNNRDVLGSYYTEEAFAQEITIKAFNDFSKIPFKGLIKIADYSCGGGAFLVSACEICNRLGYKPQIIGYDVDPIAIIITRFRLLKTLGKSNGTFSITLGNPLLQYNSNYSNIEKMECAILGRYYNEKISIHPENDIDIVLGNPPWEKIRFEEKKFLKHYTDIEDIGTQKERSEFIKNLSAKNKSFYDGFVDDYEKTKKCIKRGVLFSNSCSGELNTYALFTELCLKSLSCNGIAGIIVKSSLLKMPIYSSFFKKMISSKKLYEIYMFSNRKKIFNIDSREEFSVIYLGNTDNNKIGIALNLDDFSEFYRNEKIYITDSTLIKINPETGMLPSVTDKSELEFLITVYDNYKTFGNAYKSCHFGRLVHLTNHAEYIEKDSLKGYLPIYEGKFIELYSGKFATFKNMSAEEKYKSKAVAKPINNIDGNEYPESRFYIKESKWVNISKGFQDDYVLCWRSLTSSTNRRTMLATVMPLVPTCQSIQLLQLPRKELCHVLALFNSIIFDYIVRLKMAGLDLTQTIIKQIPVPDEKEYQNIIYFDNVKTTIEVHIVSRIKVLYSSDMRMSQLFNDMSTYDIKGKSRTELIAEIDKLVACLYGIDNTTLIQIAKTFSRFYGPKEIEELF